jgi:hypothetical protein
MRGTSPTLNGLPIKSSPVRDELCITFDSCLTIQRFVHLLSGMHLAGCSWLRRAIRGVCVSEINNGHVCVKAGCRT